MPIELTNGSWRWGWAMDLHSKSSEFIAPGIWDTKYTPHGLFLNRIKYHGEKDRIQPLANNLAKFLSTLEGIEHLSSIIPVPPSTIRSFQPLVAIADALGEVLRVKVLHKFLLKTKNTESAKNMTHSEREEIFRDVFVLNPEVEADWVGKNILLFDDLYDTGTTSRAICNVLYTHEFIENVYFLAITKTRRNPFNA